MMKLILFGLLAIIVPGMSTKLHSSIQRIEVGDPYTHVCNERSASWYESYSSDNATRIAHCEDCPSKPCEVHEHFRNKLIAYCNGTHPIFFFNSIPIDIHYSCIECPANGTIYMRLIVGLKSGHVFEKGDPYTHICPNRSASWYGYRHPLRFDYAKTRIAYCEDCPSLPCVVDAYFNETLIAFCNGTHPTFFFNSLPVGVDYSFIRCPVNDSNYMRVRVGRNDGRLHSENNSTVALEHKDFTLFFDRSRDGYLYWFDGHGQVLVIFQADCTEIISQYSRNKFNFNCDENTTKLHINDVSLVDDDGEIFACSEGFVPSLFRLTVNGYDGRLHSENNSTVALKHNNFTLIFDRSRDGYLHWLDGHGQLWAVFHRDCTELISNYYSGLNFTCDENTTKLHMNNVTLADDGEIFACSEGFEGIPSLFRLTVNVPVTSVSIQDQSQVRVENKEVISICKVEESKPKASFKWIMHYQDGSSHEIHNKSTTISTPLKRKLWQTISTVKLKFMRDYQKIMCKATVDNLHWTDSEYQSLHKKEKSTESSTGATVVYFILAVIIFGIFIIGGRLYSKSR